MRRRGIHFLPLISGLTAIVTLAACGGGGGGGGTPPTPPPTPTPTPTFAPGSVAVYCNPNNPNAPQSRVRSDHARSFAGEALSHRRFSAPAATELVPGVVSVTYDRAQFFARREALISRATNAGATVAQQLDFAATGKVLHILRVRNGSEDAVIAAIKADPAVLAAGRSVYRHTESTTPAFTNDPYLQGFTPTNTPPFYEGSAVPGQWDAHVVCAPDAWGYANANSTGSTFPGAAGGSANVPIAIIDTGADLTHPELMPASRITYAESDINGTTTVGVSTMHDDDGHGTDVAGIAAASGNDNLGFAGVAYNAPLMIFKVFPDPPCPKTPQNPNGDCEASSSDIALAIKHAVAQGAKVINLSLGASTPASDEESAVANAIAQGVIVVAAAGNGDPNTGIAVGSIDFPAADPGVIAVGASAIDDTNPSTPLLKVASYSNYAAGSNNWGVVAPGGDPCPGSAPGTPCNDADNLHWIENIYSSTATVPGTCKGDYPTETGTVDCRVLIAGTSQATPHVSGAAALLLSVGASQSPSSMQSLLCSTARVLETSATNSTHQGCGELDVYHAMNVLLNDPVYP